MARQIRRFGLAPSRETGLFALLLGLGFHLGIPAGMATTLTKVQLNGAGRCMDGSTPAFYYDASSTSDRWIIILEGSNLCKGADGMEADTAADCPTWCNMDKQDLAGAAYTVPGVCDSKQAGSTAWKSTLEKGELFSGDPLHNPSSMMCRRSLSRPAAATDGWGTPAPCPIPASEIASFTVA